MVMKRNTTMAFVAVMGILHACAEVIMTDGSDSSDKTFQEVSFRFTAQLDSRGSVAPDETVVRSVAVYAYEEGELVDLVRGTGKDDFKLTLASGSSYTLYALANMPDYPEIRYEDDFVEHAFEIGEVRNFAETLPMAWNAELHVRKGVNTQTVSLERLTSRIGFGIEKGLLDYMDVVSVKLCQAPSLIRPFMNGGSRAVDATEVGTGDYASEADVTLLNEGQEISLYVLENRQGTLLPSNEDPWRKVPDSLDETVAACCTYLEVCCRFPESNEYGVYCGDVIYRFYLGEDAVGNFSITRNTVQNVALITTEDGLEKLSWKVDASGLVYRGGDVDGGFVDNFHSPDNFYVSEYAHFEFDMDSSAEEYWRRNPYELVGIAEDGEVLMSFSDMVSYGGGSYSCLGKALKPGQFDVWLVDDSGKMVECLYEGGVIRYPVVVIGNGECFSGNEVVQSLDEDLDVFINGQGADVFVYLVDTDGYNINQEAGCDCSMMDWELAYSSSNGNDPEMSALFEVVESSAGSRANESFVYRFGLSVRNDGDDSGRNRLLSSMIGRGRGRITVNDESGNLSSSHTASIYAGDIDVMLTTSSPYSSRLGTGMAYYVTNPSKLPFTICGWKVNSAKDAGVTSYYNDAVNNVNGYIETFPMFMNVPDSWSDDAPLYFSRMPLVSCSFEDSADQHVQYGNAFLYPAYDSGVSDAYMKYAIEADRRPLAAGGHQYRTVSDRSHILQTAMMYDCAEPPRIKVMAATGYGTIRSLPSGLEENPVYVEMYFNDSHQLVAVSSEPVSLDIDVSGTLSSHIRTVSGHDLIIGSLDIRYYKQTHEFSSCQYDVDLSGTPVVVDDSSVQSLLQYIRTIEYYSRYDSIDAREVLKPYAMTLSVDIVPKSGRPVYVSFPGVLLYRYENINYTYGEPPSTFNYKVKDVPNAEAFVDDDVYLAFTVSSSISPEMNLVKVIE